MNFGQKKLLPSVSATEQAAKPQRLRTVVNIIKDQTVMKSEVNLTPQK